MRLANKRIVITAAGQGIGRASALACAREGAIVFASDINEEALATLIAEDSRIQSEPLDVTDRAAVQAYASHLGKVDALFNCAGYVHHGTILDCDPESWDFSFRLNVTSMYDMIRAFLPQMLAAKSGSIINMASVASSELGVPNRFVYGASKAAVIGLSKALAADFVGQGIRCNVICPGTVQSPSLENRISAQGDYETVKAAFVARQPMGRLGTVDEIAHLVVYLASDESAYTTGTTHVIDGGWRM